MSAPTAFISYRRDDAAGWASKLQGDLKAALGVDNVGRDVDIPYAVDYEVDIERMLDTSDVVLVVIGPRWATVTNETGQVRLQDPDDVLRREIERALSRPDVKVIPVLVPRAEMPKSATLPETLRALTRLQAFELSDRNWARDVDALTAEILTPRRVPVGGAAWLVAAGAAGVLLAGLFTGPLAPQRAMGVGWEQRLFFYGAERGLIWALAGALALVAACIALSDDRAGAIGWAIIGAGFGAAAGALGGAAFIALKDLVGLDNVVMLHGLSTALTGAVLGGAIAQFMSGDRTAFGFAGLVGGLLGGIIAVSLDPPTTGTPEGAMFLLIEAIVLFGALVAVRLAVAPGALSPRRYGAHAAS